MTTWRRLWRDERGELTALGVLLIYTVLALGAIVGLVALRNQIVQELGDLAVALRNLDQSFSVVIGGTTYEYDDDETGSLLDEPNEPPAGIDLGVPPADTNDNPGEDGGP
ncbi:MAG: hypothetical protein HUU20_17625 [Pirellulales bacterium]|nr:hypothetical protein [Pirellulales bacterium]